MYRRVFAISSAFVALACSGSDDSPFPGSIQCIRSQTEPSQIVCNNGDVYHGTEDGGGSGGGGGAGGSDETGQLTHYCYSFPSYQGFGVACQDDADCPATVNPCQIPTCGAAKTCTAPPAPIGTKLCGSDDLYCNVGDCCGWVY